MIFNYLYQDKLFKNKRVIDYFKESNETKKIKFSLNISILFFSNIKKFFLLTFKYFFELILGFNFFLETFKKKNSEHKNKCIILDDGCSLNKLRKKNMKKFQDDGNKIFAINYWNENKKYNKIIPNYLILSDPKIFKSKVDSKNLNLYKRKNNLLRYINKNSGIILIIPSNFLKYAKKKINNTILTFSDSELDFMNIFTNPFFPRGYFSVPVVNALSVAKWLNFKKIFLLGIDNTFFRYLFSDKKNRILYLNIKYNKKTSLINYSNYFDSTFDYFMYHIKIFRSFETLSKSKNIFNLDEYSLTSFFKKKKVSEINK